MASIRKRALRSGATKWQVDYRDSAGKRRHRQFTTKREADSFLIKARAEVSAGIHTPDSESVSVTVAGEAWLTRCARDNLERSTIASYERHVRLHITPYIGATKLSRLSTPSINAFVDQLFADGRSAKMIKRVLASLSAIVSEAQRRGMIANNPVTAAAEIKISRRGDALPEMPSRDELQTIIAAETDSPFREMFLTIIFTGLRGSEARGLLWEDVDLKAGILHVRRRVDEFNQFGPPKSEAGTRDIPLAPIVIKTLREWRLRCPRGNMHLLVFPNGAGNVESHSNILSRGFWPLQMRVGITVTKERMGEDGQIQQYQDAKYSLHALRHAAAALWIEQQLSPKRIQRLMGHSSIQQTFDTYGYLFDNSDDDAIAAASIEARLIK